MAIEIYDYSEYRKYLIDWFADPDSPTARAFALMVGCSSALVSAIKKGDRDLDPTKVSGWSRALGHDVDETRYFAMLVDCQSPARIRRVPAQTYVRAVQRFRSAEKVDDARLGLFLNWYYTAILELARCETFQANPEWIAARLTPPITPQQAAEALDTLQATGLLNREGDKLVPVRVIATPPEIPPGKVSAAVYESYLSAFERAGQSIPMTPASERHFSTMMISLPLSAVDHVKRRMHELEQELIAYCDDQKDRERVYQLAFLLFPVSRPTNGHD